MPLTAGPLSRLLSRLWAVPDLDTGTHPLDAPAPRVDAWEWPDADMEYHDLLRRHGSALMQLRNHERRIAELEGFLTAERAKDDTQ